MTAASWLCSSSPRGVFFIVALLFYGADPPLGAPAQLQAENLLACRIAAHHLQANALAQPVPAKPRGRTSLPGSLGPAACPADDAALPQLCRVGPCEQGRAPC